MQTFILRLACVAGAKRGGGGGREKGSNYRRFFMEARSGQNHDNKIALQVNFNPTAANIMDLLHIFVINKQYLFQRVSNFFLQHELFLF